MQTISIYSPQSEVMKKLLSYLRNHRYKNISINYSENKITAERKQSLLKKNNFLFNISNVSQTVTNIKISVNPGNAKPTSSELEKEAALAERIYS